MIRQSLLESWRRNFCEKTLRSGAWDLGGVPHLAPEGGLVLSRHSRVSLTMLSYCRDPRWPQGGGISRKIRPTKERFLIVFRETTYAMLGNLGIKAM